MTRRRSKAETFLSFLSNVAPEPLYLTEQNVQEMRDAGLNPKHFATYLFEVRHTLNVDVQSIREGRKVVAYQLGHAGNIVQTTDPSMPSWPERGDF